MRASMLQRRCSPGAPFFSRATNSSPVTIVPSSMMMAGQVQAGLEVLLDGKNNPLRFAFGPGVIRLGVQEPDAQARTDDASVIIGEGAALVGVEFGGQTAALEGFFESLVKGLRVGPQIVSGVGKEARVIVDNDAQESGSGFGARSGVQIRAGRKIRHPQIVDEGRLETFGGSAQRLA